MHLESETERRDLRTDREGQFFADLPPGRYRVVIVSEGFETYLRENLVVGGKALRPLLLTLQVAARTDIVTVAGNSGDTDADNNASSLTFEGGQLASLSSNDATLQQQIEALAGGGGGHNAQIYVDGFSGGRIPPKTAISAIRFNRNPYSAQYSGLGIGRVEISTKPGSDKLHGTFQVRGNDNAFNARNPFAGAQPPYHTLNLDGNVSGPLDRKTSFFLAGRYDDQQNNAVVNAVVLNGSLNPATSPEAVPNPQTTNTYSARLDRQLSSTNNLFARYEYNENRLTNGGVGLLTLADEGYNADTATQTLQAGDTQILDAHRVNETRFQYIRTRLVQTAVSNAPSIIVQGAFNGGGAPSQFLRDNQDRYEFQDYLSLAYGKHFLRLGARFRLLRTADVSTANYNGQYTFPNIAAYQLTQQGLQRGLSAAQIRANGGGATQFSLTAGQPSATLLTGDLGAYLDDEWKLNKRFTLNLGLRFETQTAIPDHSDPAPRVGFAWSVHPNAKGLPLFVVRGGFGLFYDRFDAANLLQSIRQNGVTQQSFYLQNPDTFPTVPPVSNLTGTAPTPYRVDPHLRSEYDIASGLSVERNLGKLGKVSFNYTNTRSVHYFTSLNVNAPLPGTFDPAIPTGGVRPLGGTENLYQYSSPGSGRGTILLANYSLRPAKWATVWGVYVHQHLQVDANGASSFASDSYNVHADYGRSTADINHTLETGGTLTLPFGVTMDPYLIARSGRPYNITTGADNNGDSIYNDRPTFATDLSRSSIKRTALGNFDTAPLATDPLVPSNYGNGPAYVSLQLQVSKSFKFGPRPSTALANAPDQRPEAPFELDLSAEAQNIFNHVNGDLPIGVLTSDKFGQSISLDGTYYNNSAANRTVYLRASFSF